MDKKEKTKQNNNSTQAWGIAGLVLGILSIFPFTFMPYIGIFMAIISVVFYGLQKKNKLTGCATAGLVLGIIGIIINSIILLFIFGLLILATLAQ